MSSAPAGIEKRDVAVQIATEPKAIQFLPEVDVAPPGHTATIAWAPVSGATSAEVTAASATIGPALTVENAAALPFTGSGNERVVAPPQGRRVRSLTLSKLALPDGTALTNESELRAAGRKIVIALPDPRGGWAAPQFAAPSVEARGMLPRSLTGASYSAGVLTLPDVAAPRLRLTIASGSFPEEFTAQDFTLEGASGQLVVAPTDLTLTGPTGATLWSFPGELGPGAPNATADLRVPLETAFEQALASGGAVQATVMLQASAAPGRAGFTIDAVHGTLLRELPDVASYALEGAPVPLALGAPLAAETPSAVTADVRIRYEGLRLHETLRDPLPPRGGAAGVVVGQEPVLRTFPPAAFQSLAPGRLGVVGRAPEACELSVSLVEAVSGGAGSILAGPAVAQLEASTEIALHWFELPELTPPVPAAATLVRATQGRFFWVAGEAPATRVAVRDPDPGGRPLTLGGSDVLDVTADDAAQRAIALPREVFRNVAPALESDLFLTVEIGTLTLRYAR